MQVWKGVSVNRCCRRPLVAGLAAVIVLSLLPTSSAQLLRRPRRGPAASNPAAAPQTSGEPGSPAATTTIGGQNNCTWELYDLSKDWTQDEDVAAKYPAKVQEMKQLSLVEAKKYQVLPLDASVATRLVQPQPNLTAGRRGTGTLKVDGKQVATQKMERTLPIILQWDESFDIGSDTGTPVCDEDYQCPFALTAKLNKLTVKIDRPKLSPADIKLLEQEGQRNNRASE